MTKPRCPTCGLPQPIIEFYTEKVNRCIHRIRPDDVPRGLDPEDVAIDCCDDPKCPHGNSEEDGAGHMEQLLEIRRGCLSDLDWERHAQWHAAMERAWQVFRENLGELLLKHPEPSKFVAIQNDRLIVGDDPDELMKLVDPERPYLIAVIRKDILA